MRTEPIEFRPDEISASLSESEQRYQLLFECAPGAMYVFDVETLRILAANDAAIARYGYSRDEFLGLTLRDLRPASELARFWRAFAAIRAGHEIHGSYRHRARSGEIFDVEITTRALPIGDGRLRIAIAREISAARRAADAAHYLDGATRLLTSALDETMICRNLAAVAVPRLGDWCAVHCARHDGTLRFAGFTHANPLDEAEVGGVVSERTPGPEHPAARALASSRTVVLGGGEHHGDVFGTTPGAESGDPRLHVGAALYVPIRARGRTLAVLECVATAPRAAYADADVALAEELASRAAMAVDNARLYAEARRRALPRPLTSADPAHAASGGQPHEQAIAALSAAAVIESMLDGFIAVDATWRITYANRGAERTLRCPREEMVGSSLWALFPGLAESEFGAAYHRARTEGRAVSLEGYYRGLDAWFDVGAYPVNEGLLLFFRNTSDRHLLRETADSLDHALRDCLEEATDLVHMISPDGRVLFANAAWRATLGYTAAEVDGLTVYDVVPPEWHERLQEARNACLAGQPLRDVAFEVLARDGHRITVRGSVRARIARGEPVATFGIFRDVTAEQAKHRDDRAAAAARRARTDLLRRMSHSVRTPLNAIIGLAQLIEQRAGGAERTDEADYATRITRQGYQLLELVEDVLAFADIEAHRAEHEDASASLEALVAEVTGEFAGTAAQQGTAVETTLPPTLAPLATDRARLRQILRALVVGALRHAAGGAVRITVTADDATTVPLALDIVVEPGGDDAAGPRGGAADLGLDIARSLAAALGHELAIRTPEAGRSFARLAFAPTPAIGGTPARPDGARDGSGAVAGLLHTVISASPLAVIVYDTDLTVRLWNDAATRVFGWTAAEVLGRRVPWDSAPPDQEPQLRDLLGEALRSGAVTEAAVRRARKDGRVIDAHASIAPLRDADGTLRGFVSMVADVTEKRRIEEELRQAQRTEVVGRLAGGIAHDFNNLLTVIRAYGTFLLEDFAAEDPRRGDAEEIVAAVDRAAALTRQLMIFARKEPARLETIDVCAIVGGYEKMLRRLVPTNIELAVITASAPCHTTMDPAQLEQVVMNLVLNARDAMPRGGVLGIEVERVGAPAVPEGEWVRVTVADTGMGMDEATRAQVFEPFFTTKPAGRGTGLGLATVQEVVSSAGGRVEVESRPGAGTTFRILLPAAEAPAFTRIVEEDRPTGAGTETILLVEDQDPVRAVAARMLRSRGYTVLTARHGRDALDLVGAHDGRIDVLVTDLVMPELDGYALAARLRELLPDVPVVFISGYSEPVTAGASDPAAVELAASAPTVPKPLTTEALARAVREALGARA